MSTDKDVLLRAAYDILTRCHRSCTVLDPGMVTAYWDGAACDGGCLREEIASVLGIEENEDPIPIK